MSAEVEQRIELLLLRLRSQVDQVDAKLPSGGWVVGPIRDQVIETLAELWALKSRTDPGYMQRMFDLLDEHNAKAEAEYGPGPPLTR